MTATHTVKRPNVWHAGAVLSVLMAFASISTDFYLPAMPAMADAMDAGHGAMEITVTGYLVGLSLGQLLWGPIGDGVGRRRPVAAGIVLFVLGSAGCGLSDGVAQIVFWRVVQAVGASASIVLSRAMVRDLYDGARAAQVMSVLMAVMTVAPLVAPSVGALILGLAGWRAIFALLVVIGLAALAALFTLPETLPPSRQNGRPRLGAAFRSYARACRNRMILGHALIVGFFYVGMFGYVAASPAAFIDHHGVSSTAYGLIFAAGVGGITTANLTNSRLVARLGTLRALRLGGALAAVAGVAVAGVARLDLGGAAGLFVPIFLFLTCTGLIVPNALSGAMEYSPDSGSVSALCGAFQYGGGIVGSALVGLFADGTAWPLGWVVALAGMGTLFGAWVLRGATDEARSSFSYSTEP